MFDFKDKLTRIVESGYLNEDSTEIRQRKAALTLVPLIIGPAAFIWGLIYFYLGHPLSGSIPMSYSVISALTLVHYFKNKENGIFRKKSAAFSIVTTVFFNVVIRWIFPWQHRHDMGAIYSHCRIHIYG